MQKIEFDAKVENGKIEVPDELQDRVQGTVHVTVTVKKKREGKSYLRELIENPIDVPNFKPLTRDEIYDRTNR